MNYLICYVMLLFIYDGATSQSYLKTQERSIMERKQVCKLIVEKETFVDKHLLLALSFRESRLTFALPNKKKCGGPFGLHIRWCRNKRRCDYINDSIFLLEDMFIQNNHDPLKAIYQYATGKKLKQKQTFKYGKEVLRLSNQIKMIDDLILALFAYKMLIYK